jgi:hypothetical protein
VAEFPDVFDHSKWSFSPAKLLDEGKERVETAIATGSFADLLAIVPGKQVLPSTVKAAGLDARAYIKLVVDSLATRRDDFAELGARIEEGLTEHLPPRRVAVLVTDPTP